MQGLLLCPPEGRRWHFGAAPSHNDRFEMRPVLPIDLALD